MRIVDLSVTISNSPETVPEALRTTIEYTDHAAGALQIEGMFGVTSDLLRDGEGWAVERFTNFGTHNSTHVDAPWHYNSQAGSEPARTIDELPLEWFFAPGVVLDMTHRSKGEAMTPGDAQDALAKIGYQLQPRDIVLVRTDCDRFYDQADYMFRGCGVSAECTHWLYEQGVRVMGIDAWGWDAPLDGQAKSAIEKKEKGIFWQAHQADLQYSQIERLCNLAALPSHGFKVACFPLKIERGSGAPARVVAMVEE